MQPSELSSMTWNNGVGQSQGEKPQATFTLTQPEAVHRLRLKFVLSGPATEPVPVRVSWRKRNETNFEEGPRSFTVSLRPGEQERFVSVPVHALVAQFRLELEAH